uniref:Putative secreted protein n=1 Tax=Anopheles marajoara TaxID=58244 RepID=A0A2M4C9J4_9DIPT
MLPRVFLISSKVIELATAATTIIREERRGGCVCLFTNRLTGEGGRGVFPQGARTAPHTSTIDRIFTIQTRVPKDFPTIFIIPLRKSMISLSIS